MGVFRANLDDSVHQLKVAVRQAQADIKKHKEEIDNLKAEINRLNGNAEATAVGMISNENQQPCKQSKN